MSLPPTFRETCPVNRLPNLRALLHLLDSGPAPFHAVLVRVSAGDEQAAVDHLIQILRGQGCLFRLAPGLLNVQLPAHILRGGQLLIAALQQTPGPPLQLRIATGTWQGTGEPSALFRTLYEDLMSDLIPTLEPLPAATRSPAPAKGNSRQAA